jgi:molybdate transport system substrate-binding protein
VALAIGAAACGRDTAGGPPHITVLAAASLTNAFTDIGDHFTRETGIEIRLSTGGSDTLAQQIIEGSPADVFASASTRWMDEVESAVGVDARANFARNRLVIVTPPDDPGRVSSLRDLTRPGLRLVLAAEGVPAGDYAREALTNAGLDAALDNVVSEEQDVLGVLQKVLLGEADAGIAYVTDVTPDVATEVRSVEIPDAQNVMATYPIAVVQGSGEPGAARRFVTYVHGEVGQDVLNGYGFLPSWG